MLEAILQPYQARLDAALRKSVGGSVEHLIISCSGKACATAVKLCETTILGSLVESLAELNMFPIPKWESITYSPYELEALLKSKTILASCGESSTADDVNKRLRWNIVEALNVFEVPSWSNIQHHFEIQEAKSGVGGRLLRAERKTDDKNGHELEEDGPYEETRGGEDDCDGA